MVPGQREAHQWIWSVTQSRGKFVTCRKKRSISGSSRIWGIKKLCYKTAILIRLVVEKNGTQKKSTLWFKTTSNNWQVNHFTTFSCLGPHTHLKMPLSSWAPKALPFIFLRCNLGGVWKDLPAPDWVALSPELHLLMCLDESRLWP